MSKISYDGLTPYGTGCFIAVCCTHMATVCVKGLSQTYLDGLSNGGQRNPVSAQQLVPQYTLVPQLHRQPIADVLCVATHTNTPTHQLALYIMI